MKKIKVLLDFIRFAIPVKIEFYRNVIVCLTSNITFENPDVELARLNEAVNKLTVDYQAAQTGLHKAVAQMHQSETAADDLFRLTARYVDRIANGDEAIILSAGFNGSKQPVSSSRPHFTAENGENPCEIVLKCKTHPNARSYTWQFSADALPAKEEDWKYAGTSTQATFAIKNLNSLVKYWFRVAPVTSEGMQPWIGPIMKVAV